MNKQASTALAHRNWTGLTLAELIDAGRVVATDTATVHKFVKEANGEASTIEEAMEQIEATSQIAAMPR